MKCHGVTVLDSLWRARGWHGWCRTPLSAPHASNFVQRKNLPRWKADSGCRHPDSNASHFVGWPAGRAESARPHLGVGIMLSEASRSAYKCKAMRLLSRLVNHQPNALLEGIWHTVMETQKQIRSNQRQKTRKNPSLLGTTCQVKGCLVFIANSTLVFFSWWHKCNKLPPDL